MQINRRFWYVYMQEAGGDGGTGGAAAGAGEGAGGNAGAGEGAGGAGSGAESAAGASIGSVLADGAGKQGDAGSATTDYIPEKYQVKKDDGTLDLDASSRKLAEAYGNAEKRIGSGDVRPKAAEEYTVTVPEAFAEVFKPEEDPGFQEFRTKAFEAGMTQKQLDLVMGQYFTMAPQLVAGAAIIDSGACKTELEKTWATPATYDRNIGHAFTAVSALAGKAGIDVNELMSPKNPLGNNPQFLRLMAALGPELAEDKNPNNDGNLLSSDDLETLMVSDAYTNPSHKDHAKVSEKVRRAFERKHGTEAAA